MGKSGKSMEKAQRRVTKTQRKLRVAIEEYEQERVRGLQAIERVRLEADSRLAKVARRVERITQAAAEAEADTKASQAAEGRPKKARAGSETAPRAEVETPAAAADALEHVVEAQEALAGEAPVIVPDGVGPRKRSTKVRPQT